MSICVVNGLKKLAVAKTYNNHELHNYDLIFAQKNIHSSSKLPFYLEYNEFH